MPSPTPNPEAIERLKTALEGLHLRRGKPSLRQLARELEVRQTAWSHTKVETVLKCHPKCPPLDHLLELVAVLDGDRNLFRRLWYEAQGLEPDEESLSERPVQRGRCVGRLTSPTAGATVGTEIVVEGALDAVPERHHVWIAHQDRRGLFWAKDFEVTPEDDGRFERIVYEGGSLREFTLLLLLASEAGHNQLTDWMSECSRSGSYPGIPPDRSRFIALDKVALHFDPSAK